MENPPEKFIKKEQRAEKGEGKEITDITKDILNKSLESGRPEIAANMAASLGDIESLKQSLDICKKEEISYSLDSIIDSLKNKDAETIKKSIDILLRDREHFGSPSLAPSELIISLKGKDPQFDTLSKEYIEKFYKKKRPDLAAKLAISLNDEGATKYALEMCLDKNKSFFPQNAGEIAISIGNVDIAQKVFEYYKNKDLVGGAEFIIDLAKMKGDLGIAKEAAIYYFNHDWYMKETLGSLTAAISKEDPEFAKEILEKCIIRDSKDREHYESVENNAKGQWIKPITDIAIALSKKIPEVSRKAIEYFDKIGISTYAGKIAASMGDIESAKYSIEECFRKKIPSGAAEIATALADKSPEISKRVAEKLSGTYEIKEILVALINNDVEFVRKAIEKYFSLADKDKIENNKYEESGSKTDWWGMVGWDQVGTVGGIVTALIDKDPQFAIKTAKECLNRNWLWSASKITLELSKYYKL